MLISLMKWSSNLPYVSSQHKPAQRAKVHFHRWLTKDIGHPKLQEHLSAVIVLMKASADWRTFTRLLNQALPKFEGNLELELYDKDGLPL